MAWMLHIELRMSDAPGAPPDVARDAPDDPFDVGALLVRGARAPEPADARLLFEAAISRAPECALPWLWLATVADRDDTVDACIKVALELDLGPQPARIACGELLVALGLRRRARHPDRARAILLEAQYALPGDPRVWVAMASTSMSDASSVAYLERAHELGGTDADRVRSQLLHSMVGAALALVRSQRLDAASDMLHRAAAAAPRDTRIRAVAAQLESAKRRGIGGRGQAGRRLEPQVTPQPASPAEPIWPEPWWVRVHSPTSYSAGPDESGVLTALADLHSALQSTHGLLDEYSSPGADAALLRSATRWTAGVGKGAVVLRGVPKALGTPTSNL